MLSNYIHRAMEKAHYEVLPDHEGYFGNIDLLPGVWADGENLEECREQLREVPEEWLLLNLRMGHHIPVIDKIDLNKITVRMR